MLQIRLGFAGWKSRFYREKFGVEKSNEVGKLKNDMVMIFLFLCANKFLVPVGVLRRQHQIVLTFFITGLI